jgi:hypothetical protein
VFYIIACSFYIIVSAFYIIACAFYIIACPFYIVACAFYNNANAVERKMDDGFNSIIHLPFSIIQSTPFLFWLYKNRGFGYLDLQDAVFSSNYFMVHFIFTYGQGINNGFFTLSKIQIICF